MSKQDELLAPAPSGACAPMSDAEVICSWMEPRPTVNPEAVLKFRHFEMKWWVSRLNDSLTGVMWRPRELDLDALWEVQERLTDEQGQQYVQALGLVWPKDLLHATPEQKIKALAAVLRPLVTEARGPDGPRASNEDGGR